MNFNTINCLFLSIICSISCGNKNNKEIELMQIDSSARVLFVDNTKAFVTIPKDSLFDSKYEIIPLETSTESLIGQIGRISMHNDNLYILDKRLSSVLIFNRSGKFLNKISHIGKGPGEYLSLTDFGIDTKTNNIILYCDRPKKIITYSLGDELQNEMSIEQLFESISVNSDSRSLIGINRMPIYKDYFIKYDLEKKAVKESFIPITSNKVEKMFSNYKSEFPLWIKSKNDYCVIPYVNTIHQSKGDTLKKSFSLKFQNELLNFEGGEKAANGIIKTAINDNLGF